MPCGADQPSEPGRQVSCSKIYISCDYAVVEPEHGLTKAYDILEDIDFLLPTEKASTPFSRHLLSIQELDDTFPFPSHQIYALMTQG